MFSLIPRDQAFFQMFQNAARNVIEGSRLLKEMMEDYRNPMEQARRIKDVDTSATASHTTSCENSTRPLSRRSTGRTFMASPARWTIF